MEFYRENFRKIRERKGYTINRLVELSGASRVSLWAWEKGKSIPSTKYIRILATILNVGLSEISDLEEDAPNREVPLASILKPYNFFNDPKTIARLDSRGNVIDTINMLYDDLAQATTIINSILSHIPSMFYVKDLKQKFVIANKAFIEFYINEDCINKSIIGKVDSDFFNKKDAEYNVLEDLNVIKTGLPVKNSLSYLSFAVHT
jgi:transcriptional regulator with XRE-family HTH domain